MPKNEHSILGTIAQSNPRRGSASVKDSPCTKERRSPKKAGHSSRKALKKDSEVDRILPTDDAEALQRKAREMAIVSLGPAELLAIKLKEQTETTFTEDDERACPRDLEAFRLAVALEIDRLRANKKNYDL
jgi:hypothetical protein